MPKLVAVEAFHFFDGRLRLFVRSFVGVAAWLAAVGVGRGSGLWLLPAPATRLVCGQCLCEQGLKIVKRLCVELLSGRLAFNACDEDGSEPVDLVYALHFLL